jgi:hypothetical protein
MEVLSEIPIFIHWPTVPVHRKVQMARRNVEIVTVSFHNLGGRALRLTQLLLPPGDPRRLNIAADIVRKRMFDVFIQEQSDRQHVTAGSLMPNLLTCIALHPRNERATTEIRADGPIPRGGMPSITVKITSTSSRLVTFEATATAASRTIPIKGAADAVLSLFHTKRSWRVTLDRTQRELGIRNRRKRSGIPITSNPPDPWGSKANITDSSRSIHVYRSCDAIDAQIRWEIPVVVINKVSVDLRLQSGNHIRIVRQLDITQEDIGLRTGTEEHVVLRLEPEV